MNVREQHFWGLVLLLTSFAIPLPIRSVPKVTLEFDNLQGDTIFCEGCNPLVFGQPLNVNVASIQQLMSLPNIGERRATDILGHRLKYGDFKTLEDLDDVRGIGPKTLLKLRPYIVIE